MFDASTITRDKIERAARIGVIAPQKAHLFSITADEWQKVEDDLKKYENSKDWREFAKNLFYIKLLDPSRAIAIDIGEDTWTEMKTTLQSLAEDERMEGFLSLASPMCVMAANEVRFTDGGVRLIMPHEKSFVSDPVSRLPEVRKF